MFDCSADILAFHDNEVTLSQADRTAMRDRRNANRDRLKARLKEAEKPAVEYFIKQGSYAMLTMVQDAENDYDIDDGTYFTQKSLRDNYAAEMPPVSAREMVRTALKDNRFSKQPQVRHACVRVYYNEGYHVDLPVYRIRDLDGQYELANGDNWMLSRASEVQEWFDEKNMKLSPDEGNGRQFRRTVRNLKKFARSRKTWKDQIASGFIITVLASECYLPDKGREDSSLLTTMKRMHLRLLGSLEVAHPVTPGAKLTTGSSDVTTTFLRDRLKEAINDLAILDKSDCNRKQALTAWDKTFNTTFFSVRFEAEKVEAIKGTSLLRPAAVAPGLSFPDRPVIPNKPAGFA